MGHAFLASASIEETEVTLMYSIESTERWGNSIKSLWIVWSFIECCPN